MCLCPSHHCQNNRGVHVRLACSWHFSPIKGGPNSRSLSLSFPASSLRPPTLSTFFCYRRHCSRRKMTSFLQQHSTHAHEFRSKHQKGTRIIRAPFFFFIYMIHSEWKFKRTIYSDEGVWTRWMIEKGEEASPQPPS